LALAIWAILGGHLNAAETANLVFGHLLYGLLVGAIALFAASISDSAATAAIITLAFTVGSWVLDFALAGQPGALEWISRLSLTQTLRSFEQGLLSAGLVLGVVGAIVGFAALAAVWLHPGVPLHAKLIRSLTSIAVVAALFAVATQIRLSLDVSEDRRNSFPPADQRARRTARAADHHRSPGGGGSPLRRSAAQRPQQARAHPAPPHHPPRHRRPERRRQHERRELWRDRIFLRRPLGQEPVDEPARDRAAHLRARGAAPSDAIGWR
jgi:hypothetical protein